MTLPDKMRWHVRDHAALGSVVALLAQAQPPYVVTFKAGEETRRDRQNRFSFEAYKQVAKILGDRTVNDVRAESKLHIAVPILRAEDDDFRAKYDRVIMPMPYETKLELMVEPFDFPVTRLMTVKQMAEFITRMLAHWDASGASVMLPEYDL